MNESLHIKDMIRLHFFTVKALIYKMQWIDLIYKMPC
jgi:hypothetical protein